MSINILFYLLIFCFLSMFSITLVPKIITHTPLLLLDTVWVVGITFIISLLMPKPHKTNSKTDLFLTYKLFQPYIGFFNQLRHPIQLCIYLPNYTIMDIMTQQNYDVITQNPKLGIWWQHRIHGSRILTISTEQLSHLEISLLFTQPFKHIFWITRPEDITKLKPIFNKFSSLIPQKKSQLLITDYPGTSTSIHWSSPQELNQKLTKQLTQACDHNTESLLSSFANQESKKLIFNQIDQLIQSHPQLVNTIKFSHPPLLKQRCQYLYQQYSLTPPISYPRPLLKTPLFPTTHTSPKTSWLMLLVSIMISLTTLMWTFHFSSDQNITISPPINKIATATSPKNVTLPQQLNLYSIEDANFLEATKSILIPLSQANNREKKALDIIHNHKQYTLFQTRYTDPEQIKIQKEIVKHVYNLAEPLIQKKYQNVYHYYEQNLASKFPFSRNSNKDIPPQDLENFLSDHGLFFDFIRNDLEGIITLSDQEWQLEPWTELIEINSQLINSASLASLIQDLLFDINKQHLDVHFTILKKPKPYQLSIKTHQLNQANNNTIQIHWPEEFSGDWQIKGENYIQYVHGPWAWFHIIDQHEVTQIDAETIQINIMNTGPLLIKSNRPVNPLKLEIYNSFELPAQAIKRTA